MADVYDVQVFTDSDKYRILIEAESMALATEGAEKAVQLKVGPDVDVITKKASLAKPTMVIQSGMKPCYLGFE